MLTQYCYYQLLLLLIPVHMPKGRLKCPDCDYSTHSTDCIRSHRRNKHPKVVRAAIICEICGGSFKTNESLKAHMMKHYSITTHTCSTCGKSYSGECMSTGHGAKALGLKVKSYQIWMEILLSNDSMKMWFVSGIGQAASALALLSPSPDLSWDFKEIVYVYCTICTLCVNCTGSGWCHTQLWIMSPMQH